MQLIPESFDIPSDCKAKQRAALLAALKLGPVSTLEAREVMGLSHPGGRVHEMRRDGVPISTTMEVRADSLGRLHKVGVYRLLGAPA
jgi:hypothetical protein